MRVLLIDDELAARERLRRLLRSHPEVEVVGEAEHGLAGLQQIQLLRPNVIFLDIQMPGLDGFQMLRELHDPEIIPLVIFATSFSSMPSRPSRKTRLPICSSPSTRIFSILR